MRVYLVLLMNRSNVSALIHEVSTTLLFVFLLQRLQFFFSVTLATLSRFSAKKQQVVVTYLLEGVSNESTTTTCCCEPCSACSRRVPLSHMCVLLILLTTHMSTS